MFEISTVGLVRRANMRHHTRCSADRSNRCRDIVILIFWMSAAAILDIFKFQICNGPNSHEGRTASPCQISLKSLKLRPRYCDFSIFQNGGRRHVGFLKLQMFNCGTHLKCGIVSHRQISWRLVKPLSRCLDFEFFKMATVTILDF